MSNTILITGASTGFGRKTAETLINNGHVVYASMRDPSGKNQEHAQALKSMGAEILELDVTCSASVDQAVADMLKGAGRIDVLVNNAGVASAGVTEAFTAEQVQSLFNVNVTGLHRVTRAVLPGMRKNGKGLIINLGSILGRITFPFFGIYGASKFAVEALTDSYRYEVSQLGIDVSLVQPSAYPTQMYNSAAQPEDVTTVAEYNDIAKIPGSILEHFMEIFSSEDAPDPQDVADAVSELVGMPVGQRPARKIVGAAYGSDAVNDSTAPVQNQVIDALGLSHLGRTKIA